MAIASNRESVIISKTNDQFNTNYPNSLSGIINEFEYQRSISNINRVSGNLILYKTDISDNFASQITNIQLVIDIHRQTNSNPSHVELNLPPQTTVCP
ncbi:unnamed protein product [Adineta steineri]|uniref:Uncharacterized protein n=1 Tax=Adineta steineri TaxID=433720 RepID=A0A819NKN9_9BILA|nr:unnamed protein product [Adineta steineri]